MKVALITDTHFGVRNDSPVFYEYFKRSLDHFFQYVDDNSISVVIHPGDLFDRRKYQNTLTIKLCREYFLDKLEARQIETHIITGNHDTYYKDSHEVNSLREHVAHRYNYIKIYSVPAMITVGGLDIQLIPWICESNKEQSYAAIKNSTAEVLIGHLELHGFEMFSGAVSEHGDTSDIFSRYDLVISGHYHHRSHKDNIHYIGAFAEFTWSDYNDPRGFTILDTKTRKMEFIRNPHTMFKMMAYDDTDENITETINAIDYSQYSNTYVKVVCVNRENPYAFDMMFDKLYKAGPVDISVVEDINTFIDNQADDAVDQAQDTPTILTTYISGLSVPVDTVVLTEYMRNLYVEALSVEHVDE